MGKYYFESGDTEYVAANDNTTVIGTGADNEQIILAAGVEGVVADSTIERVDFVGDIADFQFQQGFGSNIDILDGSGNVIASVGSVDGKTLAFADGSVELGYADGTVSVGGTDITTTAAAVVPTTIDETDVSEADAGDEETAPTFSVAASADEVIEGNDATFTVTLSEAQAAATTVDYAVSLGGGATAADHGDITVAGAVDNAGSGTLTFAAGETSKTITIPVTFDSQTETGETIAVTLSNAATGTEVGTASDSVVLVDPPAPTFTITSDAVGGAATEEGQNVVYTITPSSITDKAYTFTLSTIGDTVGGVATAATAADFSPASKTVSFAAGQTDAVTVVQTVVNDGVTEGLEGYKTQLLDSTFAVVGDAITGLIADPTGEGAAGQTKVFTTSIESLEGTTGDDTFNGVIDTIVNGGTFNSGDTADGKTGTDTLNLTITDNTLSPAVTLSNIEKVTGYVATTAGAPGGVSAATWTGVTHVGAKNTITSNVANSAFKVTNLQNNATLTLENITIGTDNDLVLDAAFASGKVGSATATLSMDLNGVGTSTLAGNVTVTTAGADKFTTLGVTATGSNNILLNDTTTGITLDTVNVGGTGSAILDLTGETAAIKTVSAAANSGGVTLDVRGSAVADQSITGGSGNDTFNVDLAQNITFNGGAGNDMLTLSNPTAANLSSTAGAADSLDGGAGTDTLAMTAAGAVAIAGDAAADRAVITNFEQLRVTDDLNGSTFTISNIDSINYLQVGANLTTGAATVNGFASGATVEFRDADSVGGGTQVALNVGITGATGAGTPDDILNLFLNDNLVNQAAPANSIEILAGVSGINKLNVQTADRSNADGDTSRDDGYTLVLSNDNNVDSITATGTNELSFTSTASTAALATLNASGLSGDLIADLSTNGLTQGVSVTGGTGANTITGTGFSDVLVGGARADNLTSGAGADQMTGGGEADTFIFALADYIAADASALASAADKILDFASASDIIDFGAQALSLSTDAASSASVGTAAINAEGFASFNAADDTLAEKLIAVNAGLNAGTEAAGQIAVFEDSGNTYVFVTDGAGDAVDAGDALIELTGVTGLSNTTISGGDLTIA